VTSTQSIEIVWDGIGKRLVDHCIKVNLISNGWHWNATHVERP
jgi:hypothetical protein